ncbi:hypothetical protein [Fredinandcohnia quinoae]|uniref:Uncharacterized protein n=1 Tax=Fredinandcohnia quinoae TaxID=2918902 RepID=A0AAW5ECK0_9BACI|nr:hypothetical protein [Fredinandcohnia sp. SECRCQ15]MCH1627176.1 hypothetical protein [Fredinandcohnia sp. SECRCQ15]
MSIHSNKDYKSFFWKRFFILFIPIFIIGIISEPNITQNPFKSLEDYGEFVFFLLYYTLVLSGMVAFILSITWRLKLSNK